MKEIKQVDKVNPWQEAYAMAIIVACLCILLGLGVIFTFDSKWTTIFGSLFVGLGFIGFFFAYKTKKNISAIPNSNGEPK